MGRWIRASHYPSFTLLLAGSSCQHFIGRDSISADKFGEIHGDQPSQNSFWCVKSAEAEYVFQNFHYVYVSFWGERQESREKLRVKQAALQLTHSGGGPLTLPMCHEAAASQQAQPPHGSSGNLCDSWAVCTFSSMKEDLLLQDSISTPTTRAEAAGSHTGYSSILWALSSSWPRVPDWFAPPSSCIHPSIFSSSLSHGHQAPAVDKRPQPAEIPTVGGHIIVRSLQIYIH